MKKLFMVASMLLVVGQAGLAAAQTCTVTNNDGSTDSFAPPGSLGNCINQANSFPGPFTISFNIPANVAPDIIADTEYLITNSWGVVIDGYTQPGAVPNTNFTPQPLNTQLVVSVSVVPDTTMWRGYAVFRIEASNVTIRGLNIHSGPLFEVAICFLSGAGADCNGNRIEGNFLGTDITGTMPRPSGWLPWNPPYGAGVFLGSGSSQNLVGVFPDGNNDAAERNLISGESPQGSPGTSFVGHGVLIDGTGTRPVNNYIIGNVIGSNPDITAPVPNNYGITIYNGVGAGQIIGNVIAGNLADGIWSGMAPGSIGGNNARWDIVANAIGIAPISDTLLPNGEDGIHIEGGTQDFTIGELDNWAMANVISGNGRHGIYIYGANLASTRGNGIYNNIIGLDTSGAQALGNAEDGIMVVATVDSNFIGNDADSGTNLISGNGGSGITLLGAADTSIKGNWIGRNFTGDTPRPNASNGVTLGCTDTTCCDGTTIYQNDILWNGENGIALYGPSTNTDIGSGNDISGNSASGLLAMLADNTNVLHNNDINDNGIEGAFLVGSALGVTGNEISGNSDWGVASIPYYASTWGPGGAGDDVTGDSQIQGNTIENNLAGGIISQDTEPANGTTLGSDNTIGDNNGNLDVLQAWFGAVEILDDGTPPTPITTGTYQVNLSDGLGYSLDGSTPDGGLWGPDGSGSVSPFTYDDVYTWFFVPAYLVANDGTFYQANPWTVTVVGPTSGSASYTFDGVNNDSDLGGQPAGIMTGSEFRYQVAEVVTYPDADQDGVIDTDDCAPNDANYQGPAGVPCDADSDGYCDDAISGQVQQSFCPNDCVAVMCDPSDCDDNSAAVNPGVTEAAFGDAMCTDGVDNDCDGDVDMDDSGCWECTGDADCDDGDVCNGLEICLNHVCQSGTPLFCNDGDACTTDSCDPVTGCQYSFNSDPCDDGLFCTVSDTCDGSGNCTGQARDCSGEADQCNEGTCDEGQQACVKLPLSDGTACDDGDACTMNDSCLNGACTGDPLDEDGDGYVDESCGGNDCDDSLAGVNPGASEGPAGDASCSDSLDNDCDGATDGDDTGCQVTDQCGDGVRTGSEECDDGNTENGDGCDDSCAVEEGWACRTSVEPNLCGTAGVAGDLVITEIMQNPSCVGDAEGEWFELLNVSGHDIVLRGWIVFDVDSDDHVVATGLALADGDYLVLCRNGDSAVNGNIACDYQYSGFTLGNADDELILADPGDVEIDRVVYDDGDTFPDPNGASMSLDPAASTATANDDGSNWCEAASPIAGGCGDLGTPGAANPACSSCPDADADGYQAASCGGDDCDDSDAAVNPGASEVPCDGKDNDCNEATPDDTNPSDDDGDGFSVGCGQDCNDSDNTVYPGATEICDDGIDQDCNGSDLPCDCPDSDEDGYPDASCGGSDCNDADTSIHPGAEEILCDGVDNDCSDTTPDDVDPSDNDSDGFSVGCGRDCNDEDASVHPGATEVCEDGIDQDCNGSDLQCDCPDADSDGAFDSNCGGSDCDDNDADINPAAEEICDGTDNNCDGNSDEGFGQITCGEGACQVTVEECLDGQLQQCQPLDPPEQTERTCGDNVDNDCDGLTDSDDGDCQGCTDADGDGYQDAACGGDDCDDNDELVHPGADELCTDNIDNDCDGLTDFDDSEMCQRGSSGCGCSTTHSPATGLAMLLGLLLLFKRRRR